MNVIVRLLVNVVTSCSQNNEMCVRTFLAHTSSHTHTHSECSEIQELKITLDRVHFCTQKVL